MKTLIITGDLAPSIGNNAYLLGRILPFLISNHKNACVMSETSLSENDPELPDCFCGLPIYWAFHEKKTLRNKVLIPIFASLVDRNVCSDAIRYFYAKEYVKNLGSKFQFDTVISTMEPFYASLTAARIRNVSRVLFIMDPPISFVRNIETPFRTRNMTRILSAHDVILTTPFIRQALIDHGYEDYDSKISTVGFPIIIRRNVVSRRSKDGRIRLLFAGWLYSDIRSPYYFLRILSGLDERFEVTFMGKECEKLLERYSVNTKARLVTLPNQPYEIAFQAMEDADVLINIGNSIPVHMPSKTLEYINTGKPIVNFYKIPDCPTLYYTKRYPLALNLFEGDEDLVAVTKRFIRFCEDSIGKVVDRSFIETEYIDCTPAYIAKKVLEKLEIHESNRKLGG